MKLLASTFTITALLLSLPTQAHDPSLHKDKAEKADCAALEGMDPEKMDKDDPVTQALLKKCMKQLHGKEHKEGHGEQPEKSGHDHH